MDLKPFCNKCLKTNPSNLLVTSCRHIVCSECYAKGRQKCGYCRASCKVLRYSKLPDEMQQYFKPFIPVLKKYMKIARFQFKQRSIWTEKKKHVLVRSRQRKARIAAKKQKIAGMKKAYKMAIQRNSELKQRLKRARRTEPRNPFEMNSNRQDYSDRRGQANRNGQRLRDSRSFNASSKSGASSRSNSSIIGHSPMLNFVTPRGMSSTVNTESFFNGSKISASSSFNSTGSSASRTRQVRRLLQESSIRSPYRNNY